VLLIAFVPMVALVRVLQGRVGLGPALACGWVVYLGVLTLVTRRMWARDK